MMSNYVTNRITSFMDCRVMVTIPKPLGLGRRQETIHETLTKWDAASFEEVVRFGTAADLAAFRRAIEPICKCPVVTPPYHHLGAEAEL